MLHLTSSLPLLQQLQQLQRLAISTQKITPVISKLNPTRFSTSPPLLNNNNNNTLVENLVSLLNNNTLPNVKLAIEQASQKDQQKEFIPKKFNIIYNLHKEMCRSNEISINHPTFHRTVRMNMHNVINKYYIPISLTTISGFSYKIMTSTTYDIGFPIVEASFQLGCALTGVGLLAMCPKTTITLLGFIVWLLLMSVFNEQYKKYKHGNHHCFKCFLKHSSNKCLSH